MKLELKHLAPYLPYKLQCLAMGEGKKQFELQGISDCYYADLHEIGRTVCEQYDFEDVFPILRPLSDLSSNEWINEFLGTGMEIAEFKIWAISQPNGFIDFWAQDAKGELQYKFGYSDYQNLLKHHFDVFGLIEKGLAIDINTLKQ